RTTRLKAAQRGLRSRRGPLVRRSRRLRGDAHAVPCVDQAAVAKRPDAAEGAGVLAQGLPGGAFGPAAADGQLPRPPWAPADGAAPRQTTGGRDTPRRGSGSDT